jgi:membrane fusion protein, multidrug efflux system
MKLCAGFNTNPAWPKHARDETNRIMNRFKPAPIAFACAAVLLALAGCKRPKASAPGGPLPVNVIIALERDIMEWDEFTGRMEAVESVDVRARVSGYLQSVNFKAGAIVKQGDLLFVIDPRPYQADLDRATAELERAGAQLKLAQIEYKRADELRAQNATPQANLDQKFAAFQQAEASVRSAKAAKDTAALNIEFTQIKSPIAGRVSNERVTVGNLVQTGAGPESVLTTVVSIDPLYVYVDADENSVLKFLKQHAEGKRKSAREAQIPAFVQLADEENFPHEGYIDFVDNRLDPATGTLRARGVFKTWDPLLAPGFFVRMRVPGGEKFTAILIDDKVISSEQGQKYVFVVKPDKTVERRNITTGTIFERQRVVREGLKAGEQIVSTRLQILQPGMPVQPILEEKSRAVPAASQPPKSEGAAAAAK